ncbi:glycogen/starch/alpha-glucan phosphorylase [Candidatus Saccharibacteria bacterium]|nr:glycogen/starch/alpha-glucan phosphorylase [Candidatus Saccharibacteria bacterium]MCL1962969.1 glycogen/starch/alpha-glucan phosphorylase [Candidatus Saccharibacteria bacterium]
MSGKFSINTQSIEDVAEFYAAIERGNLRHKISPERPYVYVTMEVYDMKNGIRGAGGLGVLAADTRRVAEQLEIPFVTLTPFYQEERHQKMNTLIPYDTAVKKTPIDFGFNEIGEVFIKVSDAPDAVLNIYEKILGSTRFLTMTEPEFGQLYSGDSSGDHRLYQMVSLGFGGYAALKMSGLKPAVIQLNETATVFATVARLDELCRNGMNIYEAIVYVRKHTLFTNHTLVQAADSEFTINQFNKFVFPNITSPALKHYIRGLFKNGCLRMSNLAIELAEAKNGVSRLHARIAEYYDLSGERVDFKAVTNGIDMNTWIMPGILEFYRNTEIIDKFDMPSNDYLEILEKVEPDLLREFKKMGRVILNKELETRKNQYGTIIQIPDDAMLFEFKRRFVEYKRPWMPFENIEELKAILRDNDAHYIMAGMMPGGMSTGDRTYDRIQEMLHAIADDEFLRERVHYITDYDENLSAAMSVGSDVSINVPEVGWEACGTSFMKDIANLTLLISTNDGGVADIEPPAVLEVKGKTYDEEVASLYDQMRLAAEMLRDDEKWIAEIRRQLGAYLPIISGTRMMQDYLKFLFKPENNN